MSSADLVCTPHVVSVPDKTGTESAVSVSEPVEMRSLIRLNAELTEVADLGGDTETDLAQADDGRDVPVCDTNGPPAVIPFKDKVATATLNNKDLFMLRALSLKYILHIYPNQEP